MNRLGRFGRLVAVSVSAILVSTGVVNSTSFAEAVGTECEPVAIVAFRGSGEKNLDAAAVTLAGTARRYGTSALTTNGWEGPMLSRLFDAYVKTPLRSTWPVGFSPDRVPVLSIGYNGSTGYPAIRAEAKSSIFGDLITSSNKGAAYAVGVINDFLDGQPAGCATKFIGVGYSQGAMAARTLAQSAPTLVSGVIDLGDPYQKPNAAGNDGVAVNGEGIVRWWEGSTKRAYTDKFYDLAAHKSATCHDHDPICSYSWLFGLGALVTAIEPHGTYLAVGTEAKDKGLELSNLAAKLAGAPSLLLDPTTSDGSAPVAALAAVGANVTGLPLVFSASDGATGGRTSTYAFDLDGDGGFETVNAEPAVELSFATVGRHVVSVRITDAHGRSAVASTDVDIVDQASTVRALPDPENPATRLAQVTISAPRISVARPATVSVGDTIAPDELVGGRLVSVGGAAAWSAAAVAVFVPMQAASTGNTLSIVPTGVAPGNYTLLVFTDRGRHASIPVSVVGADGVRQ